MVWFHEGNQKGGRAWGHSSTPYLTPRGLVEGTLQLTVEQVSKQNDASFSARVCWLVLGLQALFRQLFLSMDVVMTRVTLAM